MAPWSRVSEGKNSWRGLKEVGRKGVVANTDEVRSRAPFKDIGFGHERWRAIAGIWSLK